MLRVSVLRLDRNIEVPVPVGVHGQRNLDGRPPVRRDPERAQGDQFALFTEQPELVELTLASLLEPRDVEGHLIAAGASYADPLPQALVLTAIVIGFGMTAYLAMLALRALAESGTDHVDVREEP